MKNITGSFLITFYISRGKTKKNGLAPVFGRITINSERANFQVKRDVNPDDWDISSSRLRGKTKEVRDFNEYLQAIQSRAQSVYNELLKRNHTVTPVQLRDAILGIKSAQSISLMSIWEEHLENLRRLIGKETTKATVQKYRTCKNHMQNFLRKKLHISDLSVKQVSPKVIEDFGIYLKADLGLSYNTATKFLQNLKKIILIALKHGMLDKDPFIGIKLSQKEVARPYLTEEELKKIIKLSAESERMDRVKDFFIFSCFTGLAYSDVKKLRGKEIIKEGNEYWVKTRRQKTNEAANIPLLPVPLSIIEKYNSLDEISDNDPVLPMISNQKINKYLKELAEGCNINKNLSFHVARHTFATTVTLMNGVPIESVSKMLGHKDIRSTQHYARIVDQKVGRDMSALRARLNDDQAYAFA